MKYILYFCFLTLTLPVLAQENCAVSVIESIQLCEPTESLDLLSSIVGPGTQSILWTSSDPNFTIDDPGAQNTFVTGNFNLGTNVEFTVTITCSDDEVSSANISVNVFDPETLKFTADGGVVAAFGTPLTNGISRNYRTDGNSLYNFIGFCNSTNIQLENLPPYGTSIWRVVKTSRAFIIDRISDTEVQINMNEVFEGYENCGFYNNYPLQIEHVLLIDGCEYVTKFDLRPDRSTVEPAPLTYTTCSDSICIQREDLPFGGCLTDVEYDNWYTLTCHNPPPSSPWLAEIHHTGQGRTPGLEFLPEYITELCISDFPPGIYNFTLERDQSAACDIFNFDFSVDFSIPSGASISATNLQSLYCLEPGSSTDFLSSDGPCASTSSADIIWSSSSNITYTENGDCVTEVNISSDEVIGNVSARLNGVTGPCQPAATWFQFPPDKIEFGDLNISCDDPEGTFFNFLNYINPTYLTDIGTPISGYAWERDIPFYTIKVLQSPFNQGWTTKELSAQSGFNAPYAGEYTFEITPTYPSVMTNNGYSCGAPAQTFTFNVGVSEDLQVSAGTDSKTCLTSSDLTGSYVLSPNYSFEWIQSPLNYNLVTISPNSTTPMVSDLQQGHVYSFTFRVFNVDNPNCYEEDETTIDTRDCEECNGNGPYSISPCEGYIYEPFKSEKDDIKLETVACDHICILDQDGNEIDGVYYFEWTHLPPGVQYTASPNNPHPWDRCVDGLNDINPDDCPAYFEAKITVKKGCPPITISYTLDCAEPMEKTGENLDISNALKIYPNPSRGQINCSIPMNVGGDLSYSVCSVDGELFNFGKIESSKISVSGLKPGHYSIMIIQEGLVIATRTFSVF